MGHIEAGLPLLISPKVAKPLAVTEVSAREKPMPPSMWFFISFAPKVHTSGEPAPGTRIDDRGVKSTARYRMTTAASFGLGVDSLLYEDTCRCELHDVNFRVLSASVQHFKPQMKPMPLFRHVN